MALLKPNIVSKAVTTAGTREQILVTTTRVPMVIIQAKSINTGKIYVGDSTVSSTLGIELSAGDTISYDVGGEAFRPDDVIDLTTIWIDSSVSGEGVNVTYLNFI